MSSTFARMSDRDPNSFTQSSYWLTFINTPFFLRNLYDQDERSRIQPSLVLAGLALATLVRSSELELGVAGRHRAIRLRDAAQSALEASSASQWIDLGLAEAAMVSVRRSYTTSANRAIQVPRSLRDIRAPAIQRCTLGLGPHVSGQHHRQSSTRIFGRQRP